MRAVTVIIVTVWLLTLGRFNYAQENSQVGIAAHAGQILQTYCQRCHKGEGSESGYAFNVSHAQSMVDGSVVVAEDADNSEVYSAMFRGRMPPRNRPQLPRPSAEEIEVIKHWIIQGANEFPKPVAREPIPLKTTLGHIHRHITNASRDELANVRYLTIAHLINDPTVDASYLDTARAALAKALNSLSWEPALFIPQAIDDRKTIYAVDISKLGWKREHWNALVEKYPYAVGYESHDENELAELDAKIQRMRGSREPYMLRADWFVAVGTKPPLYHTLIYDLALPALHKRASDPRNRANPKAMTALDLEDHLGVGGKDGRLGNIRNGKAQRCGFTESGVSGQNRLLEWHPLSGGGYYWISYDFKSSNRTAILAEFPLGPVFNNNPFNAVAFEHDGGEIIFSLPNGLQGYLLVDGKGNRIDAGPIEVVGDSLKTSGNEQIVTGVSCIACHRSGMIEAPDDEVRKFSSAVAEAKRHVARLYPENSQIKAIIEGNRNLFVSANEKVLKSFLNNKANISELPEPVGEVARRYHLQPMTIDTVAAELCVPRSDLAAAIKADPELHSLGLRILLREGGTIKRAAWESPAEFPMMKNTARQFKFDPQ